MTSLPPESAPQPGTCYVDHETGTTFHNGGCSICKPGAAPDERADLDANNVTRKPEPPQPPDWPDRGAAPENQPRPVQHICGHGTFVEPCKICAGSYHHAVFDRIPTGEAQSGVPQTSASVVSPSLPPDADRAEQTPVSVSAEPERGTFEDMAADDQYQKESLAMAEPGAHPPPDEPTGIPKWTKPGDWFFLESPSCVEKYSVQQRTDSGCTLVCSTPWHHQNAKRDMQSIADLHNRARTPQPVSSEKESSTWVTPATNAGLSRNPSNLCDAEITGTISAPDASESSSLNQQSTEVSVAPSKLSAQEFYETWRSKYGTTIQPWTYSAHAEVCDFAEQYASSSNAALIEQQADAFETQRQIIEDYKETVSALEGQLRAKEESWEKEMANWGIQHSEQQAEVERLQEALRVERLKVLAEIHAYQTKRMWDGAISFMKKDISDYERAALGDLKQKGGAS